MKQLTALTNRETLSNGKSIYVALCPELDIASQGDSREEALANLKEAVEGFFSVVDRSEIERRLDQGAIVSTLEVAIA